MPKATFSFLPPPNVASPSRLTPVLQDLINEFKNCFYMPDPGHVLVALAAYVASLKDFGSPLWIMLVGGPSGGKTEAINVFTECPGVHEASAFTVAALLSGSKQKDRHVDSTGGLLYSIGSRGLLALKDFTSILCMPREPRQQVLAALREIYDGRWRRSLGADGGSVLPWKGKLCLIAGVTSEIDSHFEVINKLGERFLYYRLPEMTISEQERQADKALDADLKPYVLPELVQAFFADLNIPHAMPECNPQERNFLRAVALIAARGRSSIERDSYDRSVNSVHSPESPARLVKQLRELLFGLQIIGVPALYRYRLIRKVAFDSMPPIRERIFAYLANRKSAVAVHKVASDLNLPYTAVRRALEDLKFHGVLSSFSSETEDAQKEKAHNWELRPKWRELWQRTLISELSDDELFQLELDSEDFSEMFDLLA